MVDQDEALLHTGIPGGVGRCWHYDLSILQGLLWREESSEEQFWTLIGRYTPLLAPPSASLLSPWDVI